MSGRRLDEMDLERPNVEPGTLKIDGTTGSVNVSPTAIGEINNVPGVVENGIALPRDAADAKRGSIAEPVGSGITKENPLRGIAAHDLSLPIVDGENGFSDVLKKLTDHYRRLLLNGWQPTRWENALMPGCVVETPLQGEVEIRSILPGGTVDTEVTRLGIVRRSRDGR